MKVTAHTLQVTTLQACEVTTLHVTGMLALGFPAATFGGFLLLDLFLWIQGSSSAVPFGTMPTLLLPYTL